MSARNVANENTENGGGKLVISNINEERGVAAFVM
jgi:hypothetical protein